MVWKGVGKVKSCVAITVLALLGCLSLHGCNQSETQKPTPPPTPTDPFDDIATGKVATVDPLKKIQDDIKALDSSVTTLQSDSRRWATISAYDEGYSIANTEFGAFIVMRKSFTPYLDGFKVKLKIGNLTSIKFTGAKVSVFWGSDFGVSKLADDLYGQAKEFSVTNEFLPGAYTTIDLILAPANPVEVKTIRVRLDFNVIGVRD
jgi:hypothetical protein